MDRTSLFIARLPLPPSVNDMHIVSNTTKRKIISPEWRAFKKEAAAQLRAQLKLTAFEGGWEWYAAEYHFWFDDNQQFLASDWDNRIKAAQDALCKALGINDNLIRDGRGVREGVGPIGGYTVVEVFPYGI